MFIIEHVGDNHIEVAKKKFLLRRNFKSVIKKIKSYFFKDHLLSTYRINYKDKLCSVNNDTWFDKVLPVWGTYC